MDNTTPLIRALISAPEEEQRIRVSKLGRYLVWLPELGDDRGLRLREDLTKKIATRLKTEFGVEATTTPCSVRTMWMAYLRTRTTGTTST
jgi:hypothetical protein